MLRQIRAKRATLLRIVILQLSPGGLTATAIVVPKVYIPIAQVFLESELEIALVDLRCGLFLLVSFQDVGAVDGGV